MTVHRPSQERPDDQERLIIFTRYPEPGRTKTRLIPALGPEGAARVHREMTRHTLRWAEEVARPVSRSLEVRFEGGSRGLMQQCFGAHFDYHPQADGDLGQRLAAAFADAFQSGVRRTVIVGTDCPGITPRLVETALARLREHDLVLGPATDGGYYLIGLTREIPPLFARIPWGTSAVLSETLRVAENLQLSTSLLEPLDDVDRPEDIEVWNREKNETGLPEAEPRISIVIPTLNEADCLGETLRVAGRANNVETLVVDADSRDATSSVAQEYNVRVIEAPRGRAVQMNAGASAATGQILLFLHADTRLPEGFDRHVRTLLAEPGVAAGAFQFCIAGAGRSLRLIQRATNLRARLLQMPYGDQTLFLNRDTFRRLGGFSEMPILEDFDLVRRLRRVGRVAIAPADAVTSARRWHDLGPWRTTWINQMVLLGHYLGVAPGRLADWYHDGRSDDRPARALPGR